MGIVGKTEKPSPTLTAEITSVNLNPTWTVPSSIAKTEISAHMRKDPGYLSRMHMDVLDAHDTPVDPRSVDWSGARTPNFTVRQQSGAWNALGAVKIDMPNSYSVYMHDTNQIAVLPFANLSSDPEQEYFTDGMVEDIITGLSRSKSLFVIARHSTFTYKGEAVDIKQVGRELGVRYVLEGSVRKSGNRVRITAQLIEAATGAHLWADRFDSQLKDIFDLQDQVTSSVTGAIFPQLERAEIERAKRRPTESLQAYDYYLRALSSIYQFTREENIEALKLSQAANVIDPEFAAAYAIGAYCYLQRKLFGWKSDAAQERVEARRLVKRAIELDKDDPTVLAMAGQVISDLVGEVEDGAVLISRAINLDPNLVIARHSGGWEQLWLGNVDAALEQFHVAVRLSPLDPLLFFA